MVVLISILSGIVFVCCAGSLIDDVKKPDITVITYKPIEDMTTYSLIEDFDFMTEKKSAPGVS